MKQKLDHLLERLAAEPADRSLHLLEQHVWARLEANATAGVGWKAQMGLGAACVGLALGLGTLAGGMATAQPSGEFAAFSPHATLAPSTLLEGRR